MYIWCKRSSFIYMSHSYSHISTFSVPEVFIANMCAVRLEKEESVREVSGGGRGGGEGGAVGGQIGDLINDRKAVLGQSLGG